MTTLTVFGQDYTLLDPLPVVGRRILLQELAPAMEMGILHPHLPELVISLVAEVTGDPKAGASVLLIDGVDVDRVVHEIAAAYDAEVARALEG